MHLARKRITDLFTSGRIKIVDQLELELSKQWATNALEYVRKEKQRRMELLQEREASES